MRSTSALFLTLVLAGCASIFGQSDVRSDPTTAPASFENLHATLWTATSTEYRATAEQAYRLAALMLDRALFDPLWTASTEQLEDGGYGDLPPAVILDVDETVLDNTTYQARLIRDRETFSGRTWSAWVEEADARPVPGALEFTTEADYRGIRVIYLTNRDAESEEATRRNLAAWGFPLDDDPDAVLSQGEIPEWLPSDKSPRRRYAASTYRILLLIGDNMADFVATDRAGVEGRAELYERYADWWGSRWITLPNPQYGSWESAAFENAYDLDSAERRLLKLRRIRERADS